MKKKKITIEFNEEKLNALAVFLEAKETNLETELENTVDNLYKRFVPKQVQHFISETAKNNSLKIM